MVRRNFPLEDGFSNPLIIMRDKKNLPPMAARCQAGCRVNETLFHQAGAPYKYSRVIIWRKNDVGEKRLSAVFTLNRV